MVVGERLKKARREHGYTQDELAAELGLSKSAISLYENEKRSPGMETIIEMIYLLGVSADYLLGTDEIVEITNPKKQKYSAITREELLFLNELKKDRIIYNMLFQDYKRGIEIIKHRL